MHTRIPSASLRNASAFGLSAIIGGLAVTAPVLLGTRTSLPSAPISGVVRAGVEHVGLPAVLGLLVAGAVARYLIAAPVWLIGLGTVAALPLFAIAEMLVDPTSHSMWPIEFVVYGIGSVPGILGAVVGHGLSPHEYPVPAARR
jgi:hypothetical protein